MTASEQSFAVDLTDKAKTHEEWLAVVRFGRSTLLENQNLLAEIIVREAQREAEKSSPHHKASDCFARILHELQLKLTAI